MGKYYFVLLSIILSIYSCIGKEPFFDAKALKSPPPRIIRTCCAFGSDVNLMLIPAVKITEITCLENIGAHSYLGNNKEGNGIIYTFNGGFIDLGHLRDQADWTAYLFSLICEKQKGGDIIEKLGREGGLKTLKLKLPPDLNKSDAIKLAGKIAYDLSVWHEIATWFGASTIPLVPERYSSFSIEDAYSNLLGVTLGMKALKSNLPYEEAMTQLIAETLDSLCPVTSIEDTYEAMEEVREIWWTRDKRLPNKKILIERYLDVYPGIEPKLVPGWEVDCNSLYHLYVPESTNNLLPLSEMYELGFKLNRKFPFKKMFPAQTNRAITQKDFGILLSRIELELTKHELLF